MRKICALTLMAWLPLAATALECPTMPKQASRDAEVEVRVGVRLLGDAAGKELQSRTRQLTTDMLGKLPGADRVYLEQMLFASYCSSLRDNSALTEAEREKRVLTYRAELQRSLSATKTSPPKAVDPRDKARADLERRGINYSIESFHGVIRDGDLAAVRLFIRAGMNVNAPILNVFRDKQYPIDTAIQANEPEIIDELVKAGSTSSYLFVWLAGRAIA